MLGHQSISEESISNLASGTNIIVATQYDATVFADTLRLVLQSYHINADRTLISDLILASVFVPPKLIIDSQILKDSILRILQQYRLNADTTVLADTISFTILRNRGFTDSVQFSDRILSAIEIHDSVLINRAKPISRPRWLFDTNISGTRRFSSEDLEKP